VVNLGVKTLSANRTASGKLEAVSEWNGLRQTGGIDAFLDAITRLMWVTGYSDDVVKDKLAEGLKRELALDWVKVRQKPKSVEQQIAMLRDNVEDS
jgi:hypothetical protein